MPRVATKLSPGSPGSPGSPESPGTPGSPGSPGGSGPAARVAEKCGLVCRQCGCQHFRVVYLKRLPNGVLMRRRECRYCGRRVSTREQMA